MDGSSASTAVAATQPLAEAAEGRAVPLRGRYFLYLRRMLCNVCRQPNVLVLLLVLACATAEPLLNLHADNFDRVIEQHEHVVVHFWAPGVLELLPNALLTQTRIS